MEQRLLVAWAMGSLEYLVSTHCKGVEQVDYRVCRLAAVATQIVKGRCPTNWRARHEWQTTRGTEECTRCDKWTCDGERSQVALSA